MKNAKTANLLKTIGAVLLVVAVFGMLCVSDVVRLNPFLEGASYFEIAGAAKNSTSEVDVEIVIPGDQITEDMETKFEGSGAAFDSAAAETIVVEDTAYVLSSLEELEGVGGKLSTDKYGAVKTVEADGAVYGLGKMTYSVNGWEQMSGYDRAIVSMAAAMIPAAVVGALLLLVGIIMGTANAAAAAGKGVGSYLADVFAPKKVFKFLSNNIIIVLILLFAVVVAILKPKFASADNIRNLLSNTAIRFIIALGVSGCLITKGTDLSAGRVAGLAACLSAILLQRGDYDARFYPGMPELPIIAVLLIVLALCAVIGMINGSIIAIFKVPPFIATLGMQTLVYGICLVYTGASPIGGLRKDYTSLATAMWATA